jgi:hypothetical protein
MKEINSTNQKPIIEAHYPLQKKHQFMKRWIVAERRKNWEHQTGMNRCTEAAYHRIIEAVKQRFLMPGELYYDRDYKQDKTENCCAMHSFITPTFYIYLECSFDYEYRVEYAFWNCPFEAEIRTMLRPYPLDRQAREVTLKPDFTAFFDTVLRIQDPRFIHSL